MGNLLVVGDVLYFREDVYPAFKDIPIIVRKVRTSYSKGDTGDICIDHPIDGHDWWFGQASEFEEWPKFFKREKEYLRDKKLSQILD